MNENDIYIITTCPWCNCESFSISKPQKRFYCWGCSYAGELNITSKTSRAKSPFDQIYAQKLIELKKKIDTKTFTEADEREWISLRLRKLDEDKKNSDEKVDNLNQ